MSGKLIPNCPHCKEFVEDKRAKALPFTYGGVIHCVPSMWLASRTVSTSLGDALADWAWHCGIEASRRVAGGAA